MTAQEWHQFFWLVIYGPMMMLIFGGILVLLDWLLFIRGE